MIIINSQAEIQTGMKKMTATLNPGAFHRRVFQILVAYRWASLLPALWLFQTNADIALPPITPWAVLAMAAGATLSITIFQRLLNRLLVERPLLLGLDLIFVAGLLAASGGMHSPYYLYALSPLLAGAFFFQIRGAVLAVATFTPLYLLALTLSQRLFLTPVMPQTLLTQLAGIWLISGLFAYSSVLLRRLQQAHAALTEIRDDLTRQNTELASAHRQLEVIHDLTVSLQAAPDVQSVQQQVLQAITKDLGIRRVIVGLVNPITQQLGNWHAHPTADDAPPVERPLTLALDEGPLVQGLLERRSPWWSDGAALTREQSLNTWLDAGPWFIVPLVLREHPVGVILVQVETGPDEVADDRLAILTPVASQAAVALGTTMLCIDRARRLAVEQERNRIARDIHDTVAQSLFGVVFTLEACIKLLPTEVENVQHELVELRDLASRVRNQVRRSIFDIWPSELTLDRYMLDLRKYMAQWSHPQRFQVEFNVGGNFDGLSPAIRRGLYRVTQEALTNSAHHAGVDTARVCLRVEANQVYLNIQDRGLGFDPDMVLAREHNRERFGLLGIQERIHLLGGECKILSRSGQGTQVLVRVPLNGTANGE
jgi:signal transduction histidine kinase